MKPTQEARMFAEALGKAVAFGASVTCCDIFNSPTVKGYVHYVPEPQNFITTLRQAFTNDALDTWKRLMDVAENVAIDLKEDPCKYGVVITRNRDSIGMGIGCHHYSLSSANDSALAHNADTVWDLADIMTPITVERVD
jgi:hypothetical protein